MIKIPKEDIDKKKHKRYREPNVKNKDILLMPNNNI